jgi:hypothetical protein
MAWTALPAVALVATAVVAARPTATPAQPFLVVSTLDGKTVLPHHVRWDGSTTLPGTEIKKVQFLIDGTVRWTDTRSPYAFASDSTASKPGYLVTSWLRPGVHRFVVRMVTTGGRTATDGVTARVLPAAEVPPKLAGSWTRTESSVSPAGTYTLTFVRPWIEDRRPGTASGGRTVCHGCVVRDDYAAGPSTLTVWGSVITGPRVASDPVGGWWCGPGGPAATYTWTVAGSTLTLAPLGGRDPCERRGFAWTGTWTRTR